MDTLPAVLADRGPVLASVLFILSAVFLASRFVGGGDVNSNVPLVGSELGSAAKRRKAYSTQAKELYKKGYQAFKDKAFRVTTTDGTAPPLREMPIYALTRYR